MKTQRQKRVYVFLGIVLIALLLAAQFLSKRMLETVMGELAAARSNRDTMSQNVQSRSGLISRYKDMQGATLLSTGESGQLYPENALALYSVVDNAFNLYQIEHTNQSSSSNTIPGGTLELRLTFRGTYYDVLKALGSIRESRYLMKIAALMINAEAGSVVTGTVTILSIAQS